MYSPSSSNTTQVLGRLLCQRRFRKEKAEFSDITCSRQLPRQTASGQYDSQQKVVNHNLEYTYDIQHWTQKSSSEYILTITVVALVCFGFHVLLTFPFTKSVSTAQKKRPRTAALTLWKNTF